MATVPVDAQFVGFYSGVSIHRIDLSQVPLGSIQSIAFVDDGTRNGGSGGASGADIDFLSISKTYSDTVVVPAGEVLNPEVSYQPGFLTQWLDGDSPFWNTTHLFGTDLGNVWNPAKSTLEAADGDNDASTGTLSLGEGGQVSFLLGRAITTGQGGSDKHYIYFGEYGSKIQDLDGVRVYVSDERKAFPAPVGLNLTGDERSDYMAFGRGMNSHVGGGSDTVFGFAGDDKIFAWNGHDRLYGGTDNDWLYGEAGKDRLYGEAGHDRLYGGSNNDWLSGGANKDIFVFNTKLGPSKTDRKFNFDKIADFSVRDDTIWLDNAIFKKLGRGTETKPGKLNKSFFELNGTANDANDYLLYNKKTGILSYDADGAGGKSAVEFAQLSKHLKLTYKDFMII